MINTGKGAGLPIKEIETDAAMNYKTIIFDLDGTLLDTLEDLADACNYALAQVEAPARSLAEIRRFVGNGIARLMELAIPDGQQNPRYKEGLSVLRAYYDTHNRIKTAPYAGILWLLDRLKERGCRLAVVSNKPDTSVKPLVKEFFGDRFEAAVGDQPGVARKPAPDLVLCAVREMGTDLADAVYVGDSEVDLRTAENAGLPCISVTWGFRDREELAEAGATVYADTPEELLQCL